MRALSRLVFAGTALSLAIFYAGCAGTNAPPQAFSVSSARIPLFPNRPAERRAGELVYRGGLELTSNDRRFGGWSDIAINTDGSALLAVSDEAHWLREIGRAHV